MDHSPEPDSKPPGPEQMDERARRKYDQRIAALRNARAASAAARRRPDEDRMRDPLAFLSAKERVFVQIIAYDTSNGAYRRAARKAFGCTLKSARDRAFNVCQRPLVRGAINQLRAKVLAEAAVEPARIVRDLAEIAFTPLERCGPVVSVKEKREALKTLAAISRMLDVNVNVSGTLDVISLIVDSGRQLQAAQAKGNTFNASPEPERIEADRASGDGQVELLETESV